MAGSYVYRLWLLVQVWACVWPACALLFDELAMFDEPASYRVETTVLLNDVSRKDKEVGYKIMATLHVTPVWAQLHEQFLLKFSLHSPKLYLKGKHILADYIPYGSIWDQYSDTTFYAHWINGLIEVAYIDPMELPDVINYKKALLSLFQFPLADGEHNETDASGACLTAYERRAPHIFRKIKTRCEGDARAAVSSARRVTRYTLGGGLREVYAEELLVLGDASLGLKARAWQRLEARSPPAAPPRAVSLHDALAAVPEHLQPTPLAMQRAEPSRAFHDEELAAAWRSGAQALGAVHERAGGGGDASAARALLHALSAARRAPSHELAALLAAGHEDQHALAGLCRLLGLAATRASHAAARDFLQLHAAEPQVALAHVYLAALALAARPEEWVVLEVLRLAEEARDPSVAESALLSSAAAASRASAANAAQTVRDALARGLARCKEEGCRTVRVRALGNLRRADTVDLLLEQAERGRTEPRAALAAVQALAAVAKTALRFVHLDRLCAVALDESAPLEVRAAALDLAARRYAPLPAPLALVAYRLHERGPHELRRVLWQRLESLAPRHEAVARLPHMLEPHMRGWDARAHAGTSAVLRRATGWAAGGWRALLDSTQVARAGLLRHGVVRLLAEGADDRTEDVLAVEVWARGLEAFGGAGTEVEEEEASGGLQVVVGGARLPGVTLFNGQAELLGHVWAGTGSTPTPVLRALRELTARDGDVPLAAGVHLHAAQRSAVALALDAQAQVSLWWRTARAQLDLRAAAYVESAAALHTAWGSVRARAASHAEPTLQILANLDFYDEVRFCVHVTSSEHEYRRNVTLESQQGARRLRVRRSRAQRFGAAGRTLALGRPNDRMCRTLRSADEDPAQ